MFLFANIASHNMLKFDWGLGGITFHPVLDVDVILDFEIDLVFSLGLELQGTTKPVGDEVCLPILDRIGTFGSFATVGTYGKCEKPSILSMASCDKAPAPASLLVCC
jgi:hypothetical protein